MTFSDIKPNYEWRAAVKQYDPNQTVADNEIEALLTSMNLAPSSFGLQPYHFVVISDPKIKQQLFEAGYNQPQIETSSHLIVLAYHTDFSVEDVASYVENIKQTRGVSDQDIAGYKQMMDGFVQSKSADQLANWAARQLYIPLGFLLATAAMMKIDASPMEGFDPDQVDQILDLPSKGLHSQVMVAVGYRSPDDKYGQMAKIRKPLDQVVTFV